MIYSNVAVKAVEVEFEFGKIYQVHIGERGRGRKLLALTCPEGCSIRQGANPERSSVWLMVIPTSCASQSI